MKKQARFQRGALVSVPIAENSAKSFKVEYTKLGRFGPPIAPFEVRLGKVSVQ